MLLLSNFSSLIHVYLFVAQEKMELFGKFRVAVGGRTPGSDGSHRGVCAKTKETLDPVFWHSRPSLLYQELMASYHLTALVDGGVADGVLAATA